jgi:predicted dehydrogenase
MKKYKIAVVGCGAMAPAWMDYAPHRPDVEFVALVDPIPESAKAFRDRYKLQCGIYTDLAEAIKKSGANIAFNITPPEAHKEVTITALRAGCHVFSEKPLADTLENSLEMIRVARECGKEFFVMQNRRFLKPTVQYKSLIESGVIGKVGLVVNEFYMNPGQGTFRDQLLKHALLTDMSIHQFDMMRYMFDVDPISVYCEDFTIPGSYFVGKPAAVAIFRMTNDIRYVYIGYWSSRVMMTTWEGRWRAEGEKGVAYWDEHNNIHARVLRAESIEKEKNFSAYNGNSNFSTVNPSCTLEGLEWHSGCIQSMFEALEKGERCMTDCEDNIKSIAMTYAAIKSAEEGCNVPVIYQ